MSNSKWIAPLSAVALLATQMSLAAPKSFVNIEIELKDGSGKNVGSAVLTQLKQGVKVAIQVKDLVPGDHAFHIHGKGECKGPDFKSAGDHFAPSHRSHGFDAADGPHAGDMPNIVVGKDGTGKVEIINTAVTLGKGENSLLNAGGTALVIHAKADDYKSQPAGNAGDRVACGEIK